MTREQRLELLKQIEKDIYVPIIESTFIDEAKSCAIHSVIEELEQEPCEDVVSKQTVKEQMIKYGFLAPDMTVTEFVEDLPPVNLQESKTWQFAKWVADEIFDEDWEYNKDAFAEIACRKLAKLGIVRAKGDEWELIDPQERSDKE